LAPRMPRLRAHTVSLCRSIARHPTPSAGSHSSLSAPDWSKPLLAIAHTIVGRPSFPNASGGFDTTSALPHFCTFRRARSRTEVLHPYRTLREMIPATTARTPRCSRACGRTTNRSPPAEALSRPVEGAAVPTRFFSRTPCALASLRDSPTRIPKVQHRRCSEPDVVRRTCFTYITGARATHHNHPSPENSGASPASGHAVHLRLTSVRGEWPGCPSTTSSKGANIAAARRRAP
jgi:hypothetical protein